MARYSPALSPLVLKALYHEAKRRKIPMTRLSDQLLTRMLEGTPGWEKAIQESGDHKRNSRSGIKI